MPELWTRVMHSGLENEWLPTSMRSQIRRKIASAPIFVSSLQIDDHAVQGAKYEWGQYENLSIPFGRFWIETKSMAGRMAGILVEAKKSDGGYSLTLTCVFSFKNPPSLLGEFMADITGDGNLVVPDPSVDEGGFPVAAYAPDNLPEVHQNNLWTSCATMASEAFDLLKLLGCKNVSMAQRRQTDAKAVAEATRCNGGHATGYRYHVLVVRPAGAKSDATAQVIGNMPRHVCRGHFAEYGPQFGKGLLFGKYEGRFYIPPHVKGDAKNGIVEKDYEVRP